MPARLLERFRNCGFADASPDLVRAHPNLDRRPIAALSKRKQIVVR